MPEVVSATGLMKSFSGVTVVKGIDISLNAGEAHALVGENGAGKSTVIKVLSGVHQPDSGVIKFDGREVTIANPAHAHQLGIFTVHQEPALMPELSVAENVFMGFHPHRHIGPIRWVRMSEMNARCEAVFQRLGIQMDVRESAARLTIAEQQMVEIAKSLIHDVKVLILDEPTATLSLHETQTLFSIVKRLMSQGTAVLFVSHRLHEVFELCSRVTVMRDGQMVAQRLTSELTDEQLVNLMVGRKVDLSLSRPYIRQASSPLLKVRSFNKPPYFQDVNFEIFSGEIVGLAGLIGAGRTNVAEALFGIAPADSGEVYLEGQSLTIRNVQSAIDHGIVYVPEDRHKHGVALSMSIHRNITLPSLPRTSKWGISRFEDESNLARQLKESLRIKASSTEQTVSELSGGNQQKVVFGKWLARKPKLMILDEPTRGVDVGAKGEIYRVIRELANDGVAVLVISSDLPEILTLANRILVMREGRLAGCLSRDEASEQSIMRYATGVSLVSP